MKFLRSIKYLLIISAVFCVSRLALSCKKSKNQNGYTVPPEIFYIQTVGCRLVGSAIQFSYYNDGGSVSTNLWDFGDGTTSNEEVPIHTYDHAGSFTVTLTINHGSATGSSTVVHVVTAFGKSGYTAQLSTVRLWSGYDNLLSYSPFVDTPMAIQVIDSGTIMILDNTLHLTTTDTTNKILSYADCGGTGYLLYFYGIDSVDYSYSHLQGKDTQGLHLHAP